MFLSVLVRDLRLGSDSFVVEAKWHQPPGLLSSAPSCLLFHSPTASWLLTSRTRNPVSHESWEFVFIFPEEECRLVSEVNKPDYFMMKTTVTRNKTQYVSKCWSFYSHNLLIQVLWSSLRAFYGHPPSTTTTWICTPCRLLKKDFFMVFKLTITAFSWTETPI